jgi:D-glycero-alpha-D-manno-heptose-7-phosphate kinase
VGLLNALYAYKGIKVDQNRLAEEAYLIETVKVKSPIGRQDQYAAAFGGLNYFKFKKNNKVIIKKIMDKNLYNLINDNMLLIWTKIRRENTKILQSQKKNMKNNKIYLDQLKSYVEFFNKKFKKKQITKKLFGNLISLSHNTKINLTNKILNRKISIMIEKIKTHNVYGLKLLGAGGGGFILCCLSNKKNLSKKFECQNFKIDNLGTKIIFNG